MSCLWALWEAWGRVWGEMFEWLELQVREPKV